MHGFSYLARRFYQLLMITTEPVVYVKGYVQTYIA